MVKKEEQILQRIHEAIHLRDDTLEGYFNFLHVDDADAIGAEIESLKIDARDLFTYEFLLCTSGCESNLESYSVEQILEMFNNYCVTSINYIDERIQWQSNFSKLF